MINVYVKTDNRDKTLAEFYKKCELALQIIGEKAEGYAKKNCPVDTGRLRNSITYATETKQGKPNTSRGNEKSPPQDARPEDYAKRSNPPKRTCYIGTNVEYAPEQEFIDMSHTHGRAHFLRDAATTHGDEYSNIMEVTLKTD